MSGKTEETRDLALLYSSGGLLPQERDELEARLAAGDTALASEIRAFEETAAQLALALPFEPGPRPELKERLLQRIRSERSGGFVELYKGVHVLRSGAGEWRTSEFPGISYKLLHYDRSTAMLTQLVRMEPGALYPSHRHSAVEQCMVLEGEVRIGDLKLQAGDYERADPDTTHGRMTTDSGCLLLIVASQHDELLA